jgi:hypothetical protein
MNPQMNKNKSAKFRLSDEELKNLQKKADNYFDGNVSEVIRQALFSNTNFVNKVDKKTEEKHFQFIELLKKIRIELNRIGTNINQITKRVNEQKNRENDVSQPEQWQIISEKFEEFDRLVDNKMTYLDYIIKEIKR